MGLMGEPDPSFIFNGIAMNITMVGNFSKLAIHSIISILFFNNNSCIQQNFAFPSVIAVPHTRVSLPIAFIFLIIDTLQYLYQDLANFYYNPKKLLLYLCYNYIFWISKIKKNNIIIFYF